MPTSRSQPRRTSHRHEQSIRSITPLMIRCVHDRTIEASRAQVGQTPAFSGSSPRAGTDRVELAAPGPWDPPWARSRCDRRIARICAGAPALPEVGRCAHCRAQRPEWVFVKVHTHGAPERNAATLLGPRMAALHHAINREFNDGHRYRLHYVTAREIFNIVRAAEAGEPGNPGDYRDYVLPPPQAAGVHRRVALG